MKLVAAEHVANAHVPGWILTSPDTLKNKKDKNESDRRVGGEHARAHALTAAPGIEYSSGRRRKGGLRRHGAAHAVRRHLVLNPESRES